MNTIYTKNQDEILVDDDVYLWASKIAWHLDKDGYVTHAYSRSDRDLYKKKNVKLHCLILPCPEGLMRDHINRNRLDNRRENLRICSNLQNSRNKGVDGRNKSGYKGVSWDKSRNKWEANIVIDGKSKFLKYSDDPLVAARFYDEAALHYFGEFAVLNFPER